MDGRSKSEAALEQLAAAVTFRAESLALEEVRKTYPGFAAYQEQSWAFQGAKREVEDRRWELEELEARTPREWEEAYREETKPSPWGSAIAGAREQQALWAREALEKLEEQLRLLGSLFPKSEQQRLLLQLVTGDLVVKREQAVKMLAEVLEAREVYASVEAYRASVLKAAEERLAAAKSAQRDEQEAYAAYQKLLTELREDLLPKPAGASNRQDYQDETYPQAPGGAQRED